MTWQGRGARINDIFVNRVPGLQSAFIETVDEVVNRRFHKANALAQFGLKSKLWDLPSLMHGASWS